MSTHVLLDLQIENEYGNVQSGMPDQESATKYIHWCAEMANNQNVSVPWIMCQQSNDLPPNVVRFPLSNFTYITTLFSASMKRRCL